MDEYRHHLIQHNLTLQIIVASYQHLIDCNVQLDTSFLSIINPWNHSLHSPLTQEWNWNPQSLTPSNHTIEVTVLYRDGNSIQSWNETMTFDLSAKTNTLHISKRMKENARYLQFIQPLRCILGQIIVLFVFVLCLSQTKTSSMKRPFHWTRLQLLYSNGLLHLYLISILALICGIYLCGSIHGEMFVAFQWGSFTWKDSGEWNYGYWRDLTFWGWYECLFCILPMFSYCVCHVKPLSFRTRSRVVVFRLIESICCCIPVISMCGLWILLFLNVPLNVLILSFNFTWLPLIVIISSFRICHQQQYILVLPDDKLI